MARGSLTPVFTPCGVSPSLTQTELASVGSRLLPKGQCVTPEARSSRAAEASMLVSWITHSEGSQSSCAEAKQLCGEAHVERGRGPPDSQHHLPCPAVSVRGSRFSSPSQVTIIPADT